MQWSMLFRSVVKIGGNIEANLEKVNVQKYYVNVLTMLEFAWALAIGKQQRMINSPTLSPFMFQNVLSQITTVPTYTSIFLSDSDKISIHLARDSLVL